MKRMLGGAEYNDRIWKLRLNGKRLRLRRAAEGTPCMVTGVRCVEVWSQVDGKG